MKLLIADDDPVALTALNGLAKKWGYEPVAVADGNAAWEVLQREDSPFLALLDWHMPGRNGNELCRLARSHLGHKPLHIILITATGLALEEKVNGLGAGADDYLFKTHAPTELRARLQVGERIINLQLELRRRVKELEDALAQVKQIQGLLPICMDCKRIRDDHNYWHKVEQYIAARTDASFTHGLCPTCFKKRVEEINSGKKREAAVEKG